VLRCDPRLAVWGLALDGLLIQSLPLEEILARVEAAAEGRAMNEAIIREQTAARRQSRRRLVTA